MRILLVAAILFATMLIAVMVIGFLNVTQEGEETPAPAPHALAQYAWPVPKGPTTVASNIEDKNSWGGFARSENFPERIDKELREKLNLQDGEVELIYEEEFLYLTNLSRKVVAFPAADSLFALSLELKNKDGEWHEVYGRWNSGCVQSFHTVFLGEREYWKVWQSLGYVEDGTTLRFKLATTEELIYSNTFEAKLASTSQLSLE